jgi:hypothetical protein
MLAIRSQFKQFGASFGGLARAWRQYVNSISHTIALFATTFRAIPGLPSKAVS